MCISVHVGTAYSHPPLVIFSIPLAPAECIQSSINNSNTHMKILPWTSDPFYIFISTNWPIKTTTISSCKRKNWAEKTTWQLAGLREPHCVCKIAVTTVKMY